MEENIFHKEEKLQDSKPKPNSASPNKKVNYQKDLDKILEKLKFSGKKPGLLLHACCGPCSSYVIEYLAGFFDISIFYYNPNIHPEEEYRRRLGELKNLLPRFPEAVKNNVKLIEAPYDSRDFFDGIGLKDSPELAKEGEKGERCRRCYKLRMEKAYRYAQENGFDYFCTTLSISPFKDAEKINRIGMELSENAYKDSSQKKSSAFANDVCEKNADSACLSELSKIEKVRPRENPDERIFSKEKQAENCVISANEKSKMPEKDLYIEENTLLSGGLADISTEFPAESNFVSDEKEFFKTNEKVFSHAEIAAKKYEELSASADKSLESSEKPQGTKWLPSDFKKKGGFKRSLEISKEYGLYRQDYCGCVFSKDNLRYE